MVGPSIVLCLKHTYPSIVASHSEVVLVCSFLLRLCLVFTLDLLLDLCNSSITPTMEFLILFYLLPQLLFPNNALDQLIMVLRNMEPGEYLHHVVDLFLAFRRVFLEMDLFL